MQPAQGTFTITSTTPQITTGLPETSTNAAEFSLTSYMQEIFMTPQQPGEKSLHQKTVTLPFYAKLLRTNDISDRELLQHFVNNSAIFNKLESLIRLYTAFRTVFTEEIFRASKAEEDIRFFMERFNLKRPEATQEVKDFIGFVDHVSSEDPKLLLPIFYVQYAGLFLGRMVSQATAKWLKPKVSGWDELPQGGNGLSYWDFDGLPASSDLQKRSATLLKDILFVNEIFCEQKFHLKASCFHELFDRARKTAA